MFLIEQQLLANKNTKSHSKYFKTMALLDILTQQKELSHSEQKKK